MFCHAVCYKMKLCKVVNFFLSLSKQRYKILSFFVADQYALFIKLYWLRDAPAV